MSELDELFVKCKEYINILRNGEAGCFLIRGIPYYDIQIKSFTKSITFRKPKDMPQKLHDELNEHFEKIFGWPVRNGVFCYSAKKNIENLQLTYGKPYLLFPCGDFKYVYDPEIFDLYGSFSEFEDQSNGYKPFIKSINYYDRNLNSVMSDIISDGKSGEIMLNCSSYYLVNTSYIKELTNLIWAK